VLLWKELDHPNILPFLGVDTQLKQPSYCLISPWMKNGNALSYLKAHPSADRLLLVRSLQISDACPIFTSRGQIKDVVSGLKFLHYREPPIVHGDIKCVSVIINS
jgi:serine/threonine protein kinase